ncbi:hypothetical protein AB0937_05105 [Streptomyces sp. NPDC047880]|uniref:hypothetical protein n=1 Tax=Streptomyces sp. NPDC047880 TaxID=3155626 RepID=UPI003453AB2B
MGIRTLLTRTGPGVAPQPVPAFEAAASTVRVPVTFGTALRQATADLRRRLAATGRRPTGPVGTGRLAGTDAPAVTAALPGAGGPTPATAIVAADALAALTGLAGADAVAALYGLDRTGALAVLTGLFGTDTVAALDSTEALAVLTGLFGTDVTPTRTDPAAARSVAAGPPGGRDRPRRACRRPWARLARDCLALVLTLLPRPARTTITVYITTSDAFVSDRPDDSARHRRQGQDRWGPEPDAAP